MAFKKQREKGVLKPKTSKTRLNLLKYLFAMGITLLPNQFHEQPVNHNLYRDKSILTEVHELERIKKKRRRRSKRVLLAREILGISYPKNKE